MKQVEDAPPKQQIEQFEKYLARHRNGLAKPKAEAELAAIRADIQGRYERLYDKQIVLAKGFMEQNRFDRSKEALDKAKSIADEALREQGVALDVSAIDDLRSKAGSLEVQAGQKAAFEEARQKASRQTPEEQVRTWQDFIANNPGNTHNDDAQKTLAQLRSSLKNLMQSRFDKLLSDAERALSSRDYAACLTKLDEASRIRTHASNQLGIELNQGSLASLRSRHQTEAEKHRDYLAWQKASNEAASVSLNDTGDYDRRMSVYRDFLNKWSDNPYRKNAQAALDETRIAKTSFMSRQFETWFARAEERFIEKNYTGAFQALEQCKKYATDSQNRRIDDLARRYNAPPEIAIVTESDTVDWESPVRFSLRANDQEGDSVRVVRWDFGDGKDSGETSPVHSFEKWSGGERSRSYTVSLTVTDGHSRVTTKKAMTVQKQECAQRDRHYCKYANGIVFDSITGLEWYVGPDRRTNWYEAEKWVKNLSVGGGGWRMPKVAELEKIYEQGKGSRNMSPLLETTGWFVWSGEKKEGSSGAQGFPFGAGGEFWLGLGLTPGSTRGFAVRSR